MNPPALPPARDERLRHARTATLGTLAVVPLTSLVMAGIGLVQEHRPVIVALGVLGLLGFVAAQGGALYLVATPEVSDRVRHRSMVGYLGATVASVPLVGPVGAGHWETWAWIAGSVLGTAPLLTRARTATLIGGATLAAAVGVAWWTGGSLVAYAVITAALGLTVAAMSGLPVWLWDLLIQAQQGREAQARLAVTEERLRFATDVHDLLGHSLSVIALKAELAARLVSRDPERAEREAEEVRQLAASALTEMRAAVHGYRRIDLADQAAAIQQVLRSAGVRCTVTGPTGGLPPEVAGQLALVLREAGTNLLRHSRASWCSIEITRKDREIRMTVTNDGSTGTAPDQHSHGLRGLADRLAPVGGTLRTRDDGGIFTLDAVLPVDRPAGEPIGSPGVPVGTP